MHNRFGGKNYYGALNQNQQNWGAFGSQVGSDQTCLLKVPTGQGDVQILSFGSTSDLYPCGTKQTIPEFVASLKLLNNCILFVLIRGFDRYGFVNIRIE